MITVHDKERKRLFTWLSRQTPAVQDLILNEAQMSESQQNKLLSAIKEVEFVATKGLKKKVPLTAPQTNLLARLRKEIVVKNHHAKKSPKADALNLRYKEVVLQLRADGVSWRGISDILSKEYNFKVTHSKLISHFGADDGK